MRDIRFRAWMEKERKMFFFNWRMGRCHGNVLDGERNIFRPIMQFTGLYDLNKKPIYEGDIIGRQLVGDEIEVIGRVIFDDDFGAFCISYENGGWAYLGQHMIEEKNYRKEVIGNIYENPELLNKER